MLQHTKSRSLFISLASAVVALCAACESPERPLISTRDVAGEVRDDDGDAAPEPVLTAATMQVFGESADGSEVYLLAVRFEDVSALPVGEPIGVDPGAAVEVWVRAVGDANNSPACDFIDNPLPSDVNPCAEERLFYRFEPLALSGVLELSENDDELVGRLELFVGEDDVVIAPFRALK
jgi:hypothetical protein